MASPTRRRPTVRRRTELRSPREPIGRRGCDESDAFPSPDGAQPAARAAAAEDRPGHRRGERGRLQRVLLERALRLPDRGFSARILWFDDDLDSDLQALAVALGWSLMSQPAGDPGERMRRIAALGLAESEAVLLIRHDCPVLDGDYLEAACTALGRRQAVLGPVERGGYALLGLTRSTAVVRVDALGRRPPAGAHLRASPATGLGASPVAGALGRRPSRGPAAPGGAGAGPVKLRTVRLSRSAALRAVTGRRSDPPDAGRGRSSR